MSKRKKNMLVFKSAFQIPYNILMKDHAYTFEYQECYHNYVAIYD